MKKIKNGFSFIELGITIAAILVVYLIIIFPLRSNLDFVQDNVLKSNVDLMTHIIKLEGVSHDYNYKISRDNLLEILEKNLKELPKTPKQKNYFYGYSQTSNDFFVVICNQQSDRFIVNGSTQGIEAVSLVLAPQVCDDKAAPVITKINSPTPKNNSPRNLENYFIYKII